MPYFPQQSLIQSPRTRTSPPLSSPKRAMRPTGKVDVVAWLTVAAIIFVAVLNVWEYEASYVSLNKGWSSLGGTGNNNVGARSLAGTGTNRQASKSNEKSEARIGGAENKPSNPEETKGRPEPLRSGDYLQEVAALKAALEPNIRKEEYVTLKTKQGDIKIYLLKALSPGSVQYIHDVIAKGCVGCGFTYISRPELRPKERSGLLHGYFKSDEDIETGDLLVKPNDAFGDCPPEWQAKERTCPWFEEACDCHGPVLIKGMVAWDYIKATAGGPEFFINTYERPAKTFGLRHTAWGYIPDEDSLDVVKKMIWTPETQEYGIREALKEPVAFTPELLRGADL